MSLNEQQVQTLVQLSVNTTPDDIDCDGCYGQIAEFAEVHLADRTVSESMRSVDEHLKNCPCCQDEFEALKLALASCGENTSRMFHSIQTWLAATCRFLWPIRGSKSSKNMSGNASQA